MVAFLRLNPPLVPPILWLVACTAILLVEGGLPEFAQLAVIVISGCATASGMGGSVARKTALVPELDALLPLHPALVRASRALMPCLAMAVWMGVLSGLLVLLGAANPWLIASAPSQVWAWERGGPSGQPPGPRRTGPHLRLRRRSVRFHVLS